MSEAMFTLCGQVANVYVQPGGTSKKTGEAFDPRDKVQILGQLPMPTGGHKLELVTRDEFDIQVELLRALRTRVEALEEKLNRSEP